MEEEQLNRCYEDLCLLNRLNHHSATEIPGIAPACVRRLQITASSTIPSTAAEMTTLIGISQIPEKCKLVGPVGA